MLKPCEYCGNEHDVTQLCHARPKWSRRGFISMLGAGTLGAMLPLPQIITLENVGANTLTLSLTPGLDLDFVAEAWNRVVNPGNMFSGGELFTAEYLESVFNEIKGNAKT